MPDHASETVTYWCANVPNDTVLGHACRKGMSVNHFACGIWVLWHVAFVSARQANIMHRSRIAASCSNGTMVHLFGYTVLHNIRMIFMTGFRSANSHKTQILLRYSSTYWSLWSQNGIFHNTSITEPFRSRVYLPWCLHKLSPFLPLHFSLTDLGIISVIFCICRQ